MRFPFPRAPNRIFGGFFVLAGSLLALAVAVSYRRCRSNSPQQTSRHRLGNPDAVYPGGQNAAGIAGAFASGV